MDWNMNWEDDFDKTFECDKSGECVDGYLLMNTGKWVPGDDREWCKIATPQDVKDFIRRVVADLQREVQGKEEREALLYKGIMDQAIEDRRKLAEITAAFHRITEAGIHELFA